MPKTQPNNSRSNSSSDLTLNSRDSVNAPEGIHQPHVSSLYGRQPNLQDNNDVLTGLHNTSITGNIRRALHPDVAKTYHKGTKFNGREFWKTMVYENLPPVIGSPLAAFATPLLLKDSLCSGLMLIAFEKDFVARSNRLSCP